MRLYLPHMMNKHTMTTRLADNHSGKKTERGDTIVEVLIAIAIVSSVLAGAFTVTQKSAIAVRDSQERGEMLQLLQGQMEQVRALAATDVNDISGTFAPGYFCVKTVSGQPTRQTISGLSALPALTTDPLTGYGTCQFGANSLYNIAINYDNSPGKRIFTFTGRWDRIGGGKDQLQLTYRVYPGGQ